MKSKTIRNYIPYVGAGLIILTVLISASIIIPGTLKDKTPGGDPLMVIKGIIIGIILHLLIFYAYREMIIVNKKGGRVDTIFFIIAGIGSLILGLYFSGGAIATSKHDNMQFLAISYFICVANDIIACILAFIALILRSKRGIAQ